MLFPYLTVYFRSSLSPQLSLMAARTASSIAAAAAQEKKPAAGKRDAASECFAQDSASAKRLRAEKVSAVSDDEDSAVAVNEVERNPNLYNRAKYALLLMYSGEGYYGMQRNWEFPSIENEILDALLKKDLISQAEHSFPSKYFFSVPARLIRA